MIFELNLAAALGLYFAVLLGIPIIVRLVQAVGLFKFDAISLTCMCAALLHNLLQILQSG